MYCLHPIELKKKQKEKRVINGKEQEVTKVYNNHRLVPCGKCISCLNRLRSERTYRLKMEESKSDLTYFVTLTYDDDHLPMKSFIDPKGVQHIYCGFDKSHLQKYFKIFRYHLGNYDKDITFRYFLVSEYGHATYRSHYHLLAFFKNVKPVESTAIQELLIKCWMYGTNVVVKLANAANIHYCTKYILKDIGNEFGFSNDFGLANGYRIRYSTLAGKYLENCFSLCSKNPYIGAASEDDLEKQAYYSADNIFDATKNTVFLDGHRMAMPRIYRQKLGISGIKSSGSPDPRLSDQLYNSYLKSFKILNPNGTFAEFQMYVQNRLNSFERISLQLSKKRNETL